MSLFDLVGASKQATKEGFFLHGRYGKAHVSLVRVERGVAIRNSGGTGDNVTELSVTTLLEGDLEKTFSEGDNRLVVPTDTVKNTIFVFAQKCASKSAEHLGVQLADHFLNRHKHLHKIHSSIEESPWTRLVQGDAPHEHCFLKRDFAKLTTDVTAWRLQESEGELSKATKYRCVAGVKDLQLMKTTQSGFENFIQDEYTTLQPTNDRLLCTRLNARWLFDEERVDVHTYCFEDTNSAVLDTLINTFAGPAKRGIYSKSVQETMYLMSVAVLRKFDQIKVVSLQLPNLHHFLFDLERFGLENRNQIYYPTDAPSGLLECTVGRKDLQSTPLARL